jgi:glycosyltransferase involved in cell wall biosynthesis
MIIPKILFIGSEKPIMETTPYYLNEETILDVHYILNDNNIEKILIEYKPDAIITIGDNYEYFLNLCNQPYDIRKKWMNLPKITEDIGQIAYNCAMNQILNQDNTNLISYFTSTYNIGNKIKNTYKSLKNQTYKDWEWVIIDDSTDNNKTLSIIKNIALNDFRVKVYSFNEKSKGVIGESKYRAAMLCRGYILAELDHDDLLTDNCTMDLYKASQMYPDAGFFYTDAVEINENNQSLTYPEGFANGYGQYYKKIYKNYEWDVSSTPNINPKTIRHIVSVPNHIRAWRKNVYFNIGGHNRDLSIADDYELIIRTFLYTKFCKIPKLGYIQNIKFKGKNQNTHNIYRKEIQRRVRTIARHYNKDINERFNELGVKDWVYESELDNIQDIPNRYKDKENYVNYIYIE